MQVVGNAANRSENFNGVSDKLKKELIKPVKPGEIINLQLLNGSFDVALGREGFGASQSISLKDRIYDPYATNSKGEEVGAYVEIGVPEPSEIDGNKVKRCKKLWVNSIAIGISGNGSFQLSSDKIEDMETYEFLCLSNGSKDNPYRSKNKEPRYEVVYPEKIAQAQKDKDFKKLQSDFTRLVKSDPEKAKELTDLIPKKKEKEDVVTA